MGDPDANNIESVVVAETSEEAQPKKSLDDNDATVSATSSNGSKSELPDDQETFHKEPIPNESLHDSDASPQTQTQPRAAQVEQPLEDPRESSTEPDAEQEDAPSPHRSPRRSPRRRIKKSLRESLGIEGGDKEDSGGLDKSAHSINRLGGGSNHGSRLGRRRSSVTAGRPGPALSWKADAKTSYCDWRIEVHHEDTEEDSKAFDIFNLHRNIVGFGPRKSNFMVQEFDRQIEERNYGSGANVTKVHLPAHQAAAFPMVLDFLYYTKEVKQTLTAERACSVFTIAGMLDIPPLRDAIEDFYKTTLSLKNMTEFMVAATKAKAERLLFVSRAKIGALIIEKPELAGLVLPKFMVGILELNRQQVQEIQTHKPDQFPEEVKLSQSQMWSKAACVCASHNEKVMTKETFDSMTHEDCLPAIDVTVAFKLIMLDSNFDAFNTEYNNLQKRCVKGILDDWEGFQEGFESPTALSADLQKLPSHVLADILMKSMNR